MRAKYYENPTMLSRVTAKNVGMFFETQFIYARGPGFDSRCRRKC